MKQKINLFLTLVIGFILLSCTSVFADLKSKTELDELVAPIALYQDDLLSNILTASTCPDELDEALNYLEEHNGKVETMPDNDWSPSVKALLFTPEVLQDMGDNPEWTLSLGEAVKNQLSDVMSSVQKLRRKAMESGAFTNSAFQKVSDIDGNITIESTEPGKVYVPEYSSSGLLSTLTGGNGEGGILGLVLKYAVVGLVANWWSNNQCNWRDRYIEYRPWTLSSYGYTPDSYYYSYYYMNDPYMDYATRNRTAYAWYPRIDGYRPPQPVIINNTTVVPARYSRNNYIEDSSFYRPHHRHHRFGNHGDRPNRFGNHGDRPHRFGNHNDRPHRFGNQSDRPHRFGNHGDRPNRFGNHNDRPNRFGNHNDRPNRFGNHGDRPNRFGNHGDRPHRFGNNSDRPHRFGNNGDRPHRFGNQGDRPNRFGNNGDRPHRFGNNGDRPNRFGNNNDKPNFHRERPQNVNNGNRPHRFGNQGDRPNRFGNNNDRPNFHRERPQNVNNGNRPNRFGNNGDKPNFHRERPQNVNNGNRPHRFGNQGDRPNRFGNNNDRPNFHRERPQNVNNGNRPHRFGNQGDRPNFHRERPQQQTRPSNNFQRPQRPSNNSFNRPQRPSNNSFNRPQQQARPSHNNFHRPQQQARPTQQARPAQRQIRQGHPSGHHPSGRRHRDKNEH